jgi:hypothetical protein
MLNQVLQLFDVVGEVFLPQGGDAVRLQIRQQLIYRISYRYRISANFDWTPICFIRFL